MIIIHDQNFKKVNALSLHLLGKRLLESESPSIPVPRVSQLPIQSPGKTNRCPIESLTHDSMLTHEFLQKPVDSSAT